MASATVRRVGARAWEVTASLSGYTSAKSMAPSMPVALSRSSTPSREGGADLCTRESRGAAERQTPTSVIMGKVCWQRGPVTVVEHAAVQRGERVLEVACGTGRVLRQVVPWVRTGGYIVAWISTLACWRQRPRRDLQALRGARGVRGLSLHAHGQAAEVPCRGGRVWSSRLHPQGSSGAGHQPACA
jgi:hypothetical protein